MITGSLRRALIKGITRANTVDFDAANDMLDDVYLSGGESPHFPVVWDSLKQIVDAVRPLLNTMGEAHRPRSH